MSRAAARPASTSTGFAGFGPHALDFFKALAFHQNKAWFEENRSLYETEVKEPTAALLAALTARFARAGLPLRGDARSIFRLHRDVRFSKDKRPYKTNGGALLSRDGSKKSPGLLYLHLAPEGCFTAAGFYMPEPDDLAALRRAIAGDPKGWAKLEAGLQRVRLPLAEGDPLSRAPRGFEEVADKAAAAAIRKRSLIVRRDLAFETMRRPELVDELVQFGQAAAPLLRFGWAALDRERP